MARIVYFGTPAFAVPTLQRLVALSGNAIEVVLVVTQPDRPAGRGHRLEPSPVKRAADQFGLPVYQPVTLRHADARRPLERVRADLFVVAAYGKVFGPKTLAIPRLGCLNVHASLLPRFRGASPIAGAILAGEAHTGISLMLMETGLDTGPVMATRTVPIASSDTTESLTATLADTGADLTGDSIPAFLDGQLTAQRQSPHGASLTRPLTKADGWLDWSKPAATLERHVRAMWAWPRAWTTVGTLLVQAHRASTELTAASAPPGTVLTVAPHLIVACGDGALRVEIAQAAGGRALPGAVAAASLRLQVGDHLGSQGGPPSQPPLLTFPRADAGCG